MKKVTAWTDIQRQTEKRDCKHYHPVLVYSSHADGQIWQRKMDQITRNWIFSDACTTTHRKRSSRHCEFRFYEMCVNMTSLIRGCAVAHQHSGNTWQDFGLRLRSTTNFRHKLHLPCVVPSQACPTWNRSWMLNTFGEYASPQRHTGGAGVSVTLRKCFGIWAQDGQPTKQYSTLSKPTGPRVLHLRISYL